MKVILDTNIYFSAFAFKGACLKVLDFCYGQKNVIPFLSNEIFSELEMKFFGEKIKKLKKEYNPIIAHNFLKKVKLKTTFINPTQKINLCRDPDDNKFLELAKEVKADFLITGDKDLLILEKFEMTRILKPSEFLSLF